jgi:hypothetical protein
MDCVQTKNAGKCSCTYLSCERRGACCRCVAYHRSKNEMVACYFKPEVERTYDRSLKTFLGQYR